MAGIAIGLSIGALILAGACLALLISMAVAFDRLRREVREALAARDGEHAHRIMHTLGLLH